MPYFARFDPQSSCFEWNGVDQSDYSYQIQSIIISSPSLSKWQPISVASLFPFSFRLAKYDEWTEESTKWDKYSITDWKGVVGGEGDGEGTPPPSDPPLSNQLQYRFLLFPHSRITPLPSHHHFHSLFNHVSSRSLSVSSSLIFSLFFLHHRLVSLSLSSIGLSAVRQSFSLSAGYLYHRSPFPYTEWRIE